MFPYLVTKEMKDIAKKRPMKTLKADERQNGSMNIATLNITSVNYKPHCCLSNFLE